MKHSEFSFLEVDPFRLAGADVHVHGRQGPCRELVRSSGNSLVWARQNHVIVVRGQIVDDNLRLTGFQLSIEVLEEFVGPTHLDLARIGERLSIDGHDDSGTRGELDLDRGLLVQAFQMI